MVISLDMRGMNKIRWLNRESMTACVEAGATGQDLERRLEAYGLQTGHCPDSMEFSSLGGWISTRASGMKKNVYGNIEDIVVSITIVTPQGTIKKGCNVPRISAGPDVNEFILGHEGTLGVVTEAVVKIKKLPETKRYGAIVFPDFDSGVGFMKAIAARQLQPASIRLVDNEQFQFGQALKGEKSGMIHQFLDQVKKWYVLNYKGFSADEMCACTLVFEGETSAVARQQKAVYGIAAQFGGLQGPEENARRGYFLTFMIAYLRDFAFNYHFMTESFETAVPMENVLLICRSVKARIRKEAALKKVPGRPFVSCRVTQLYDTGACIYFYFGFIFRGVQNPVSVFSHIEHCARDEIVRHGGSISHHHGVGKHRLPWMENTVSPTGYKMLRAVKKEMDPKNIFCSGNLGLVEKK